MNKGAVMIASQILMNQGRIREAMDPLFCSSTVATVATSGERPHGNNEQKNC